MMNRKRYGFLQLALLALALSTSACDKQGLGHTLGFDRTAPDEFAVVSRPSLSVPPDFMLRPPKPGEPPRQPQADEAARSIVTGKAPPEGEKIPGNATLSTASDAFLNRLGVTQADPQIRAKLLEDEKTPADVSNATSLYEQVVGASKEEPVVDAKKEAERLRKNKDEGKAANEGDVPTEPVEPPSVIDTIF